MIVIAIPPDHQEERCARRAGHPGAGLSGCTVDAALARRLDAPTGAPLTCRAMFQGRAPCEVDLEEGGRPHPGPHQSANGLDPERGGMVQWLPGDRIVGFAITVYDVPPTTRWPVLIPIPKIRPPFQRG